ncbi:MAG: hypothetical protein ABW032_02495 [Burkholderiaceae bacterium]
MNAVAWNLLAARSRALVHHASPLMGMLADPAMAGAGASRAPVAAQAALAAQALVAALSAAPELAAHQRTIQRFGVALAEWQRCVADDHPLTSRYQTALLQQATQVLTSCLHMEALSTSEAARSEITRQDIVGHSHPL